MNRFTTFGERLRYLRENVLNLSQPQLTDRIAREVDGFNQSLLSRWELMKPGAQRLHDALRALAIVAQMAGVSFEWLCPGGAGAAINAVTAHPNRDLAVAFARACGYTKAAELVAAVDDLGDMSPREWFATIEKRHAQLKETLP